MLSRDLFSNILHYRDFDRMPVYHWAGWPETMERWYKEGLPRDGDIFAFLGAEPLPADQCLPFNWFLFPIFDQEVLEETDEWQLVRQYDGVVCKQFKHKSCIPQYIDFIFKDRSGWPEYRKRLQPDPVRVSADVDDVIRRFESTGRPIVVTAGSMIGHTRSWMGVENVSLASLEDPGLLAEVANTVADIVCWGMDQTVPKAKRLDAAWAWEDICFRNGPLISPQVFREFVAPAYRRVAEKLHSYGCDLFLVDCDGWIELLVPHWLDNGVNLMFPFEIGSWDQDPMAMRRKFGKELLIFGGIDKRVLERDRAAIDAELERRKPLMAEGGYIPLPDHLIQPGVPLDNYRYYLDRLREMRF